ncbi:protein tyrosine phosphatase [Acidithiobacillus sp. IBUN Pt1247-S3]|uniref:protein tyrosine phosphatase n=1 Tax=Acidithiobacillus sp. IBUN Pt1247-S3 TaxID=3166642 RepID=UPI0034E5FEA8
MSISSLSPADYRRFRRHQFWTDHGVFRELFYANFHQIAPGVYRSAQPSPAQLRRWHAQVPLRTVLNVRSPAPHEPHYRLEQDICDQLGIRHLPLQGFGSRDLPERERLLAALELFPQLERPLLIHCKSGADRAGLISALYVWQECGWSLEQARQQLRLWPYGHIRYANTGILDWFLAQVAAAGGNAAGFDLRQWVATAYDREALLASFRPWYRLDWVTDRLLRRE